jgi:hypothetical protein
VEDFRGQILVLEKQLISNHSLREDMTKDEFIKDLTIRLTALPQYFFHGGVAMNKGKPKPVEGVL